MPQMFKVRLYVTFRSITPRHETLIAARTRGEASRMAREAARAVGCSFWSVEG